MAVVPYEGHMIRQIIYNGSVAAVTRFGLYFLFCFFHQKFLIAAFSCFFLTLTRYSLGCHKKYIYTPKRHSEFYCSNAAGRRRTEWLQMFVFQLNGAIRRNKPSGSLPAVWGEIWGFPRCTWMQRRSFSLKRSCRDRSVFVTGPWFVDPSLRASFFLKVSWTLCCM